jgi:hypothetical protein
VAQIETEIRAGSPDLHGLCLALSDWSAELRISLLEQKHSRRVVERGSGWRIRAAKPGGGLRMQIILAVPRHIIPAERRRASSGSALSSKTK